MRIWPLGLALCMASAAEARAATVYLRDGGVLKGTVVSATANDLERNQEFSIDLGFVTPLNKIDFSSVGGGLDWNGRSGGLLGLDPGGGAQAGARFPLWCPLPHRAGGRLDRPRKSQ